MRVTDNSKLFVWPTFIEESPNLFTDTKTFRGNAMLSIGKAREDDWCGFTDLIIKIGCEEGTIVKDLPKLKVPKWWHVLDKASSFEKTIFYPSIRCPVIHTGRHQKFLEDVVWTVNQETWDKVKNVKLQIG